MNTLYVIGNGFDSAHQLKTSYWYFREYLKKYAEDFYVKLEENYGYFQMNLDDYHIGENPNEVLRKRDNCVYELFWKTIEEELGKVNETAMLEFSNSIVSNMCLESGLEGIKDTLDDFWSGQYSFIKQLQEYVFKWAKQIRLHKCVPICEELINNNEDIFLTFNYTNTLEKVYKIPSANILHIHGGLPPYCYTEPILGHGNYEAIKRCEKMVSEAEKKSDDEYISIYNAIANFYKDTLKDTRKLLIANNDFFGKLVNINTVKVIGHSLGEVDYPYFERIIQCVNDNANWNVYFHEDSDEDKFRKILNMLGVSNSHLNVCPSSEFWNGETPPNYN